MGTSERLRILAVEDDKTAMLIYGAFGKRYNFDITIVENCDAALAAVRTIVFDVILMDWQLGGADGLDCTNLMRREQKKAGYYTPIIAVTAHAMTEHRQACLDAGMDDYLSKPFRLEDLAAMIHNWADRTVPFDVERANMTAWNQINRTGTTNEFRQS